MYTESLLLESVSPKIINSQLYMGMLGLDRETIGRDTASTGCTVPVRSTVQKLSAKDNLTARVHRGLAKVRSAFATRELVPTFA